MTIDCSYTYLVSIPLYSKKMKRKPAELSRLQDVDRDNQVIVIKLFGT